MSDQLSDLIVRGALGVLVLFSVATWVTVVVKLAEGLRARRQDARSWAALGNAKGLPSAELVRAQNGPIARVSLAGVTAWERCMALASPRDLSVPREILELNLRGQIQRERSTTERGLAILASVGTTSPFIGLFGTVWGILHALTGISAAGNASLDVVAGPIGEALIATGVGIAVAVPAVLAFNYFVRMMKVQGAKLEDLANSLVAAALQDGLANASTQGAGREAGTDEPGANTTDELREASV